VYINTVRFRISFVSSILRKRREHNSNWTPSRQHKVRTIVIQTVARARKRRNSVFQTPFPRNRVQNITSQTKYYFRFLRREPQTVFTTDRYVRVHRARKNTVDCSRVYRVFAIRIVVQSRYITLVLYAFRYLAFLLDSFPFSSN